MPAGQTEKILGVIIIDNNIIQLVRIFAPYRVRCANFLNERRSQTTHCPPDPKIGWSQDSHNIREVTRILV